MQPEQSEYTPKASPYCNIPRLQNFLQQADARVSYASGTAEFLTFNQFSRAAASARISLPTCEQLMQS
jgi:hypothetical protein